MVQFDVAVVGASVAGSAVAALARSRGLSVVLVEQRSREEVASPGVRALVPVWALEASRLPVGEVLSVPGRIHVVAGDAHVRIEVPDCVLVEPGPLAGALLDQASAEGATIRDRVRCEGLDRDGIVTSEGTIPARIVVDASGARGAQLLGELASAPADIASVAFERRALGDRALAYSFLEALGAERGDSIAFLACAGPGTAVVARIDDVLEIDAIAVGPEQGGPTARAVIRRFLSSVAWAGELLASEARQLPIAAVRGVVASEHVALVGSATGGVRPTRGGVLANGLLSARLLVDAIARGDGLDAYDARWHARFGKIAAFDATILRSLRALDEDEAARLLHAGAFGERLVRAACEQKVSHLAALRLVTGAAAQLGRRAVARALAPIALPRPAFVGGRG